MNKTKDAGTREEEVGDREVVRGDRKVDPVEGQVVEETCRLSERCEFSGRSECCE